MRIVALGILALVACAHETVNAPEPVAAAVPEPAPAATLPAADSAAAEPVAVPSPPPSAPAVAAAPVERRAVQSASAPRAIGPYSAAIQAPAGRVIFLSGQIGVDPVKDRLIKGDAAKQAERAMENLQAVLEAAGATFDDVVKTTIFLTDLADLAKVNEVYARRFHETPPALATVQVSALSRGARVAIEGIAIKRGAEPGATPPLPVSSANAPKAIGPYSQATQVGGGSFLFVSGQIPTDPATGELVQGDIAAQAERVMENLKAVLASAGAGLDDVVKTNVYVVDLAGDGTKVNETYGRYFQKSAPARATVQMAALPKGARIEIEAVAVVRGGVSPGSFLFVSGQIPIDPSTGKPVHGDIGAQTERAMENVKAVLEAGGASFDKVVKTTIFVADIADAAKVNEAYGRYFKKTSPARATVQAAALPRGARVQIDCVATL
jgi:2-iminobutanoate/2-iminopropanoate deaminase